MVDKLLQSLKTKYAHLGLEESVLKAIATRLATAVKEESEIENAVKGVEDSEPTATSSSTSFMVAVM